MDQNDRLSKNHQILSKNDYRQRQAGVMNYDRLSKNHHRHHHQAGVGNHHGIRYVLALQDIFCQMLGRNPNTISNWGLAHMFLLCLSIV
jgi:hypothetical protein